MAIRDTQKVSAASVPPVPVRDGEARPTGGTLGWPRLDRVQRVAVGLTISVLLICTIPNLPPGICFDDSGDLQLAAATLGIMHPPGYPAYVTLGHLATLTPSVDPAYMVSLCCLVAGIIALWIGVLLQVRLGVNVWIAGAVMLTLALTKRVWTNLVAPEVYAPSLMFLASSAYLLIKYARLGTRRDLYMAALLYGVALANRPTVVWTLPFLILAWWSAARTVETAPFRPFRLLALCALFAAMPGVYSLSYLLIRDQPDTTYNYIEIKNQEVGRLPDLREGTSARLERLWWHGSAREFARYMGNTWEGGWKRLIWIYKEFFLYLPIRCAIVILLLVCSVWITFRRCQTAFWLLVGMALGNMVFICTYRVHGHAADLLPLMFSAAVLAGVATSLIIPGGCHDRRRAVALVLMAAACVFAATTARQRGPRADTDATPFLAQLDVPTLPRNAAICSLWKHSPVLWYAQFVLTDRRDIEVINTIPGKWKERVDALPNRPAFFCMRISDVDERDLTPYRNIWRYHRHSPIEE